MITIENKEEMEEYYVKEINTYVFEDDVEFSFNVEVKANITAGDINAFDINAWNINAWNINAYNINYWAVCVAYNNIECKSIKGRRKNSKHFVLDGELVVGGKKTTSKETAENLNGFVPIENHINSESNKQTCEVEPSFEWVMQQNGKLIEENHKMKIIIDMLLEKEMKRRGDLQ